MKATTSPFHSFPFIVLPRRLLVEGGAERESKGKLSGEIRGLGGHTRTHKHTRTFLLQEL